MGNAAAREPLYRRSDGICEICGRARGSNVQHRKNRSQGGNWLLSNLIHVCGSGTTGCHGYIHANPKESYASGWSVRQAVVPHAMPALLRTAYGQQYMWLHDDGTKDPADMTSPVADWITSIHKNGIVA